MNDTLKKWLLYGLGGLLPLWLLETTFIPRMDLPAAPLLIPLCVVAVAVLEGAFTGAQFGLLAGFVWATTYAVGGPVRIPMLTLAGMLSGVVSQYALRRSLPGCVLCAGGTAAVLVGTKVLSGLVTGLAPMAALMAVAAAEWVATVLCAPLVYWLFYVLYRRGGGKPI